jgi:UDP-3-O-[3-hydroxymyristoyl] glucosamine N-acyltransferase
VKLKKLAEIVGGEIVASAEVDIRGVAPIEAAGTGDLVFVLEEKFLAPALASPASAVVASAGARVKDKPALLVKNPRLAMAQILPCFAPKSKTKPAIHKTAHIAASSKIGKRVTIYPFVYVGENCEIGDDSILHPSVTLYDGVKLGKRVIIHAGARVGVDGYGFVWEDDKYRKIPQIGKVVIEDDVEIYANTCIARGTLGTTRIGRGSKIDCLTHIAHNCVIGNHVAITALVGFAGSVTLKDRVQVGGMSGFSGHISVGENSVVMAKAGVTKDLPPNSTVSGFPAIDHHKELEIQATLRKLPELVKKFRKNQ